MARSDKVAMCIMRYMVLLIFVVEFIAIVNPVDPGPF